MQNVDLITCFPSLHLSIPILVNDFKSANMAYNFDFGVPQRFAAAARKEKTRKKNEKESLRQAP